MQGLPDFLKLLQLNKFSVVDTAPDLLNEELGISVGDPFTVKV